MSKKVCGVDVSKVKVEFIDATLGELGYKVEGTLEEKIERITGVMKQRKKLADCESCGGASDIEFTLKGAEVCPYCGDGDIIKKSTLLKPSEAAAQAKKLDEIVAKIRELKVYAAENLWSLGRALASVNDTEVWKLRRDASGRLAYRNFNQFCTIEIGMNATYAYRLMHTSAAFSAAEMKELGVKKLGIVLMFPKAEQDKIKKVAGKTSVKELKEKVKQREKKEKPVNKDQIITVVGLRRGAVDLFSRHKNKDGIAMPARRIADDPHCEVVSENGIKMLFRIRQHPKGHLQFVWEWRKDDGDS